MPTYEYECKNCGHNFEVFQAMSDEPLKTCVKCGKEVRRLIFGGAGTIFKGSGFYATDTSKGKKSGGETKTEPASPAAASPVASDAQKSAGDALKDAVPSKDTTFKEKTPTKTS
jgi:putative FmdB family regulatory protein